MLSCKFCNRPCEDVQNLVLHVKEYHPKRDNLDLPCGELGCSKIFQSFGSRSLHISRSHRKFNKLSQVTVPVSDTSGKSSRNTTPAAFPPSSPGIVGITRQLDRINDSESEILSLQETSHLSFRNPTTHTDHRPPSSSSFKGPEPPKESNLQKPSDSDTDVANSVFENNPMQVSTIQNQRTTEAFNFILYLRSKNTPDATIKCILNKVDSLVKCGIEDYMKATLQESFQQSGIDLSEYINNPERVDRCSRSFQDFRTKWKQDKHIRKSKAFVGPRRIDLDSIPTKGKQGKFKVNRPLKVQTEQLIFISLVDIIIFFMENPEYRELLEFNYPSEDGVFKSYDDGSNFKNMPLLPGYHRILIFVYYDDVNLTDTASSRPTKMAMFYLCIGNLRATHKSSTKFIFLLLSVEQEIFKSYPLSTILSPIVQDLQKLEDGIELSDGTKIHGTLDAFEGDNLATHKAGGFKTGFTAEHLCRTCLAPISLIRTMTIEDPSLLRTAEQYDEMINNLNKCKTTAEFDKLSKEYGLNEDCALNVLRYFHAVYGIPPDIFHDIFEGSLALTLHLVLIRFLKGPKKVMHLNDFNRKMLDFDFGYSETKPSAILPQHLDESAKLHQTGAQMWSLALITPLILGPSVPLGDEYWGNFTSLLEITSLVCGYSISTKMIGYLQIQIQTYLRTFQELYERGLIPKQHFLLHYLTYILRFGPLYNYITLRPEAKHQYFKEMMRKLKNLKNPSVTMSEQHQWYQVHIAEGVLDEDEVGPLKKRNVRDLSFSELLPENSNEVVEIAWLISDGIKFVPQECFVMTAYEDCSPVFGLVETILSLNENPVFVCRRAKTLYFDLHHCAYSIEITQDEYELKTQDQLYSPAVYHAHHVQGEDFIIVKRAVGDIY
ncbi:hypothetical protein QAD02_019309 [Eretmocerus hayati]|uniref:Uncharacterized protein n=1 Tax=Eretmocerus hayati TaxID=131215 RepID=A0ACC2PMF2_9HYME|nr:hypothetical protein QAD02_019309 [Eretmocerus hayati]